MGSVACVPCVPLCPSIMGTSARADTGWIGPRQLLTARVVYGVDWAASPESGTPHLPPSLTSSVCCFFSPFFLAFFVLLNRRVMICGSRRSLEFLGKNCRLGCRRLLAAIA
ncbi:hypothetical protein L209DRAFT_71666 [Thermothelomyces heterothallicus CBS 203.75]